ncbi:hypothetical protein OIY81_3731, partial [Cryptosporidium canis]
QQLEARASSQQCEDSGSVGSSPGKLRMDQSDGESTERAPEEQTRRTESSSSKAYPAKCWRAACGHLDTGEIPKANWSMYI